MGPVPARCGIFAGLSFPLCAMSPFLPDALLEPSFRKSRGCYRNACNAPGACRIVCSVCQNRHDLDLSSSCSQCSAHFIVLHCFNAVPCITISMADDSSGLCPARLFWTMPVAGAHSGILVRLHGRSPCRPDRVMVPGKIAASHRRCAPGGAHCESGNVLRYNPAYAKRTGEPSV